MRGHIHSVIAHGTADLDGGDAFGDGAVAVFPDDGIKDLVLGGRLGGIHAFGTGHELIRRAGHPRDDDLGVVMVEGAHLVPQLVVAAITLKLNELTNVELIHYILKSVLPHFALVKHSCPPVF